MAENANTHENEKQNNKKLHRKKRVLIPLLLLVLVIGVVGVYWYLYLKSFESTDDAYIDCDAITISSKILGRITELAAEEGDSVKAGELLVQLDDSDLRSQEAQSKANLDYVEQSISVAKITLDRAQDDFDRASRQIKDKVITQEQFDHAGKALELARAQYKVAQSQVNTSQAQLKVVETQLGNTKIIAPCRAVVARKWVVPGDIVQPAQPIYTMYNLDSIWITANFEETKLDAIHVGDLVQIAVDAYPEHDFIGKVALIGAAAASQFSLIPPNNASGNFTKITQRVPVKIVLTPANPNKNRSESKALLPGMSVEVKILVQNR